MSANIILVQSLLLKASRQNLTADIVSNFLGYETKDTVDASESELVAGSIEFDEFMSIEFDEFMKAKTLIVYQTIISGHVNALKSLYIDKKLIKCTS